MKDQQSNPTPNRASKKALPPLAPRNKMGLAGLSALRAPPPLTPNNGIKFFPSFEEMKNKRINTPTNSQLGGAKNLDYLVPSQYKDKVIRDEKFSGLKIDEVSGILPPLKTGYKLRKKVFYYYDKDNENNQNLSESVIANKPY